MLAIVACLAMAAGPPAPPEVRAQLKFEMTTNPLTVIEIEGRDGKLARFTYDQPMEIEEALKDGTHYVDRVSVRAGKLMGVVFRREAPQKP
jgi:hypothetical protein